jgi:acetoin utilization deacetylase AcuC-like enzyme
MADPGLTAFVSHSDCARHDTGWKHPDHQGRLPALVRAVYRDMLQLHRRLMEVEGAHATEEQLLLVHDPEYIRSVESVARAAAESGEVQTLHGDVVLSGASWDAARAAAGLAIAGVDVVMREGARNAFCAARPPGFGAAARRSGGFSVFNNVAIAARHLRSGVDPARVLVVEWLGSPGTATRKLLAGDEGVLTVSIGAVGHEEVVSPTARGVVLPDGSTGRFFGTAMEAALDDALAGFQPDLILLAAGFDILSGDPVGSLGVEVADVYPLTRALVDRAESVCGGRIVSVLEGGYHPPALGNATVQHLRALTGLPPA